MGKPKDGGPAFPALADTSVVNPGMSLRDWFAGKAIAAVISIGAELKSRFTEKDIAGMAFAIADAMLDERERDHGA